MVTLYRDEQVNTLSYNLNIPKSTVRTIITGYVEYVKSCLREGEPCKFLNIVKFRVNGKDGRMERTLAYVANEIGMSYKISPVIVQGVLSAYEEFIMEDLKSGFSYNIRGLFTIAMKDKFIDVKKSASLNHPYVVRVSQMGRFKRRMGV